MDIDGCTMQTADVCTNRQVKKVYCKDLPSEAVSLCQQYFRCAPEPWCRVSAARKGFRLSSDFLYRETRGPYWIIIWLGWDDTAAKERGLPALVICNPTQLSVDVLMGQCIAIWNHVLSLILLHAITSQRFLHVAPKKRDVIVQGIQTSLWDWQRGLNSKITFWALRSLFLMLTVLPGHKKCYLIGIP